MNISLPATLRDWVQQQVEHNGYGSASEFVREIIRKLRTQQLRDKIDQQLLAAMNTPVVDLTDDHWERIRTAGKDPAAGRRHQRELEDRLS